MKHVLKQMQYRFAVIYGTLSNTRSKFEVEYTSRWYRPCRKMNILEESKYNYTAQRSLDLPGKTCMLFFQNREHFNIPKGIYSKFPWCCLWSQLLLTLYLNLEWFWFFKIPFSWIRNWVRRRKMRHLLTFRVEA